MNRQETVALLAGVVGAARTHAGTRNTGNLLCCRGDLATAPTGRRARDAVYWTPGLTLASLCEAGLRSEIVNLERKRGETFPKRASELKAGRPVKLSQ